MMKRNQWINSRQYACPSCWRPATNWSSTICRTGYLYDKCLTTTKATAAYACSSPGFTLPEVLRRRLFTGEDGLIAKSSVKFHHVVLEIAR